MRLNRKFTIVILVFALASILACMSNAALTADDYIQEYGGNPDVYAKILTLTDCTELQNEFNQAEANLALQEAGTPQYKVGLGYMAVSDDRMKAIGCYK